MLYYYIVLYYNNLNIQHMKNIKKLPFIFTILSFLTIFVPANAEIKVVTSIKPIHSLASYLMDGVAKPDLIVDGYASPHGFALKPTHAKMLQEADLVFWIGEDLENFLEKPLKSIAKKAEKIELMEIKGLTKLKFRERNIFEDTTMVIKKMITMIMQRKRTIMMIMQKKRMIMTITIMIKRKKNMVMMNTDMTMSIKKMVTMSMVMKDMHMANLIHISG